MRVLFVVNVDWFFISHRLPIALKLKELGYDVHIACKFTEHKECLEEVGFVIHPIEFSRSRSNPLDELRILLSVRRLFRNLNPDIVHAITIKPVLYSGIAARFIKKTPKFVFAISGLGYVFASKTVRATATRKFISVFYKIAFSKKQKTVIFQNSVDDAILSAITSLEDNEKVLIKGSGADLTSYSYSLEPKGNEIRVVMAARLLKEKGVFEFIEASRLVANQTSRVKFILAGPLDPDNPHGIDGSDVSEWVNQGIIDYIGPRDDIPQVFANSHIVVLPSYYGEGLPKVLIEAAACGRPIVTTDNPGCRDAIIDGKTGLLVPIRDSEALAQAITKLATDSELRQTMGLEARKLAEQEFDVNSVVAKHIEIYDRLMADKHVDNG
ncbi:glycosyltransferase family 4 protein [Pseudidiomarina marina]|uniref:glycosyltransferase family 4 protein n=1 Tax=Pseudidiomarina marina TaxID=502366 RepID=UPI00384C3DAF